MGGLSVQDGSARQPTLSAPSLEQDDNSAAGIPELEGAVLLGDDPDMGSADLRGRRVCSRVHFGAREEAAEKRLRRFYRREPKAQHRSGRIAGHGTRVEGSEVLERLRAQSRARLCRRLQSDGNTGESTARLRLAKARRDQGCDTVRNTFEGPCDRRWLLGGRAWLPVSPL